ncbi:hypothetical protein [Nonomuraea sp. NEAU-A123]
MLDFSRPVGVLMIAMVHFLTMDERGTVMTRCATPCRPAATSR